MPALPVCSFLGALSWGLNLGYKVTMLAGLPASLLFSLLSGPLLCLLLGPRWSLPGWGCCGSVLGSAGAHPVVGARGVLWSPSRWPMRPRLFPGPTRALSVVRPSQQRPHWKPTKGATQVGGRRMRHYVVDDLRVTGVVPWVVGGPGDLWAGSRWLGWYP